MLSRMKTTKSELQIMITGLIVALLAIAISCDDYYQVEDISPWTSATENGITPEPDITKSPMMKAGRKIGACKREISIEFILAVLIPQREA